MKIDSSLVAVVTGGASGLGLGTVKALRASGAKVAIFDRNPETGQKAAEETGSIFCECDVLSDESVDAAFAKARASQRPGTRAGVLRRRRQCHSHRVSRKGTGEIKIFPTEKFEWVLKLNTVGTFRCVTRAAAGMMTLDPIDGERGVMVNTASAAATDGQMGQAAYSAAKAGIVGMTADDRTRPLVAKAFASIRFSPAFYHTPAMAGAPQKMLDALGSMVPFPPRLGTADEYASLALEMIRNSYFNGETVRLDGAIRMQPR